VHGKRIHVLAAIFQEPLDPERGLCPDRFPRIAFEAFLVHGLGIALTLGRLLHVWWLSRSPNLPLVRVAGASLTWLVLLIGSAVAILIGLGQSLV